MTALRLSPVDKARTRRARKVDVNDVLALVDRISELEERVTDSEDRISELEGQLAARATEVRTRRLVVVEEDGFERVIVSGLADTHSPGVSVFARSDAKSKSCVSMFADDSQDDAPEESFGLALWGRGDSYGSFRSVSDGASPILGDMRFRTEIDLPRPNAKWGTVVDSEGVRPHPVRVHVEAENEKRLEQEARAARIKAGIDVPG